MRRILLVGLMLTLCGCGYKTWWNPPFSGGFNPNQPISDSENLQRVLGGGGQLEPITTEPGDIWPGALPPPPTLKDLENTGGLVPQPEQAVPGSPLSRGTEPPMVSPNPAQGSSTPPNTSQPPMATPRVAPPLTSYAAPHAAPPSNGPGGTVLQTPGGPSVVTGGTPGYTTTVSPNGGQSIVVPNGNGTSTVIHPDGRIETIPTPK